MKKNQVTITPIKNGEGLHNNKRYIMKNMQVSFLKKWVGIVCFLMAMSFASIAAVPETLTIAGISTNALNGVYTHNGGLNGRFVWTHTDGSTIYYFYYTSVDNYWNIGTVLGSTTPLFCVPGDGENPSPVGLNSGWLDVSFYPVSGITVKGPDPEISVFGNGTQIADGATYTSFSDYTKFGSITTSGGTISRTYTIQNAGLGDLSITGVSITGTNASDFTITTSPTSSPIVSSGQTQFVVRFTPSALGSRTATINITCNDADEATFNFNIQAYIYAPENLVAYGITNPTTVNGVYTHQGVLNSENEYWRHSSGTYYIYKVGECWYIDDNTNTTSYLFIDYCNYFNSPKSVAGWQTSIGTGSPNVISYVASPEIVVVGNAASIYNNDATPSTGDLTQFGTAEVGSGTITRTFNIQNSGGTNLLLSDASPYITLSGTNAADFTVTTIPTTPITAGNSTTVQITFTPTGEGSRTATVSIANNDSDENNFTFAIKGGGVYAKGLVLSGVTSDPIVNGNYTYQGITDGFAIWVHTSGTYRIYNHLHPSPENRYWCIDTDMDPDNGVCFTTLSYNYNPSPVGATTEWSAGGSIAGHWFSGNPSVVYYASEMDVTGNGITIANGDVTPITSDYTDFGLVLASSGSVSHSFSIQNTGQGPLYLTGSPKVNVSGTNAVDFTVTAQPSSLVAATSGSTTFTVLFDPSAIGVRTGTISIINDDSNEHPYTFSIQGTGIIEPTVTTQAVSSIATTTATGNGNITSLGVPNPTQYGVVWSKSSNPTVALTTKTTQGAASATGAFTSSITGLAANTTYYVNAYATNTGGTSYGTEVSFTTLTNGTFTGATNNDWATSTNWAGGSVPNSATDVTIPSYKNPIIGATTTANCNNLTVNGSLTVQSSSSGTGSLIISGTSTGTVTAERYMTGNKWHIVTPIAAFGSISTFIQAPSNAIPSTTGSYGMMDYDETTNAWKAYYTATTPDILSAGKGYSIRRASDGIVTFTGDLTSGTKLVSLSMGGMGWNCIGNPYTSAINMNDAANGTYNFLKTNSSVLDGSYACMYLWDDATLSYKILGNVSFGTRDLLQNVLQAGQGFFVKAASEGVIVQFTNNMQVHQTGTMFRAPAVTTSWPGITLTVTGATTNSSAIIAFNENMTKGLDPMYDAGLLRGTNGLSVYTRLLDNNGVDFAIQCLPDNYDNLIIPVGVDCKDGGEITFSSETVDLPLNCNVILEDRTNKVFTPLTNGASYKTTVLAGPTPIGRFFIHTSDNFTTSTLANTAEINNLKTYTVNDKIIIEGEVNDQAIATLYNLQGLKILARSMQKGSLNILTCPELISGIYLLTIQDNGKTLNRKLIKK